MPTMLGCIAATGLTVLGNAVDSDIHAHGIKRFASRVIAAIPGLLAGSPSMMPRSRGDHGPRRSTPRRGT